MMDRLFTREPSFCGNTGYNGNTQQPCGLQLLPINKRGGNKGNTYLYIPTVWCVLLPFEKSVATVFP